MHSTDPVLGTVYLIHLDIPYKHARHYWITPGTLEALIPGRMQGHGGTEEVPG